MTMPPAELQRKVGQLDNDVESIYDLLGNIRSRQRRMATVQTRHGKRLDDLARHLEAHDKRFDAVDARFDAIDKRFEGVDGRFDGLDAKIEQILEFVRDR